MISGVISDELIKESVDSFAFEKIKRFGKSSEKYFFQGLKNYENFSIKEKK